MVILLIFGALRLARFNSQIVDIETKGDFKGLPIPLSAITIAIFVYYVHNNEILEPSILRINPLSSNSFICYDKQY